MTLHSQPAPRPGFDPAHTVLLVIDPVNDFLSEGGAAWEMTKSTVKKNDVVAQLARLIAATRDAGVPVIFGPMAYTEEDYSQHHLQRRSGINRLMFETRMFLAGTWGADFHPELQPTDADVILEPHKGTDVFETDLPTHLDRLGTKQLVIAGMTANLCCESTGRHATEHGYHVTFLSDAIGAESLPAYEASIHINYPLIANAVMEVDEFLAAITASEAESQTPQVGDTVIGSDRGHIGEVEEIVSPAADTPGYLRVPRGLVVDKETYIPLDAVTHRTEGRTYVNIPKLGVGKMPWAEPPTTAGSLEKVGPSAGAVDLLYGNYQPTGPRS